MAAVAAAEGLAILLLTVLVAGLLRSHAEILRRLHDLGAGLDTGPGTAGDGPVPVAFGATAVPAGGGGQAAPGGPAVPVVADRDGRVPDLTGVTPQGDPVVVALQGARHRSLLAFFSSGCVTCAGLWRQLSRHGAAGVGLPPGVRVVIVTRSPGEESETEVRRLAEGAGPVVMSNEAWEDFAVPASPYFILVEDGAVIGEGAVRRWEELSELVGQAMRDLGAERDMAATARRRSPAQAWDRRERDQDRERRADAALLAAGIHPGHPSLYPPVVVSPPPE